MLKAIFDITVLVLTLLWRGVLIMSISADVLPVKKRVTEWKQRLIDLSRRNQLLNFRMTRSSTLEFSSPSQSEIFKRLINDSKSWEFYLPLQDEEVGEDYDVVQQSHDDEISDLLVCNNVNADTLKHILKNLYRKSSEEYQERGVRVLHIGFGILNWKEANNVDSVRSPLVMCPVELSRLTAQEPFKLATVEEDLVLNPALQVKLKRDFNIDIPDIPENLEDEGIDSYLEKIQAAVQPSGWSVEFKTVIGIFSFEKLGMYTDIEKNKECIEENAFVRALCGEQLPHVDICDIDNPRKLDTVQKPEDTFQVLDADSSQQQCIQAALRGQSLILQGPPGTGKSQTIANIIAEFIARGKTVLFVSEKIAALEVVAKRLNDTGLGEYCFELHSRKANKREVIQELSKSLEYVLKPKIRVTQEDYNRLTHLRQKLNDYVCALHEVRAQTSITVFEAMSRVAAYPELTQFSIDVEAFGGVTPQKFIEGNDLVRQLISVWPIAEEQEEFPWRGCKETKYSSESFSKWHEILEESLGALYKLCDSLRVVSSLTSIKEPQTLDEVNWWLALLKHLEEAIIPDKRWVTTDALADVFVEAQNYRTLSKEYKEIHSILENRYKESFFSLETNIYNDIILSWSKLKTFLNQDDVDGVHLLAGISNLDAHVQKIPRIIEESLKDVSELQNILKAEVGDITLDIIVRIGEVMLLCNEENKPLSSWLEIKEYKEVINFIKEYQPLCQDYKERRERLLERYDESLFDLNLEQLIDKFNSFTYTSLLKIFNPSYHQDKKLIKRCTKKYCWYDDVQRDLVDARAVLGIGKKIEELKIRAQDKLGGYCAGYLSDFHAIGKALEIAQKILAIFPSGNIPKGVLEYATYGGAVISKQPVNIGHAMIERINIWRKSWDDISSIVPIQKFYVTKQPLFDSSIEEILNWGKEVQPIITILKTSIKAVLDQCQSSQPNSVAEIVNDIKSQQRMVEINLLLKNESSKLQERFGSRFIGIETTWDEVLTAIEWTMKLQELTKDIKVPTKFVDFVSVERVLPVSSQQLLDEYNTNMKCLSSIEEEFFPPFPSYRGIKLRDLSFEKTCRRLQEMINRIRDLEAWIDYVSIKNKFNVSGLGSFFEAMEHKPPKAQDLINVFTKSFYHTQVELITNRDIRLEEFRGQHHEQIIQEFKDIDHKLIRLAPSAIIEQCNSRRPSTSFQSSGSEVSILLREAKKQKRHMPLMQLFEKIPNLVLRLKPCLMMSPLSVSQFINPQCYKFDLVIFDEASQIFTEDAIVAMYRGKQIVIAGDSKQMPPTDFFRAMETDDGDDSEYEEGVMSSSDYASVLDECGTIFPSMMLRWHYRSKHESLIAFSNRQFYDSKLVTFPSAASQSHNLGVHFVYVTDGVYDSGGKRVNLKEAKIVVDQIIMHFSKYPSKSLGVVAFSQAQMIAIEDELEGRRQTTSNFEQFFREDRLEGFFVKNLENVQGDERDVIIFSIGYGRDQNGKLLMNFGPLNKKGGERRLNVAITRAREKVILVSSIRAIDIDLNRTQAAGVLNLYHYLNYAENGEKVLEFTHPAGMGDCESPFEEDVASVIRQMGYKVIPQVGCSGFRVDLGVVHPTEPGRFILGVECDGATYHSAATARDRDRLRQQILEKLGWKIYRIWSPEWFNRRNKEIEKLSHAIELARLCNNNSDSDVEYSLKKTEMHENIELVSTVDNRDENTLNGVVKYELYEMQVSVARHIEFHLPECRSEQCRLITKIVNMEGPVHFDLVAKKLASSWGISKVGRRIRSVVEEAIHRCVYQGTAIIKGEFIWPTNLEFIPVRVPIDGVPETIRSIEHIPEEEITSAMQLILQQCIGMQPEALITETARLFGFQKTGDKIRNRLTDCLYQLQQNGSIVSVGENLTLSRNE